jgi:hypothetical protein
MDYDVRVVWQIQYLIKWLVLVLMHHSLVLQLNVNHLQPLLNDQLMLHFLNCLFLINDQ